MSAIAHPPDHERAGNPLPDALVIIGAGGFGREVLELVRDINATTPRYEFLGFLDDNDLTQVAKQRLRDPVLGSSAMLAELDARFVIAIGAPAPRLRIDWLARTYGRSAEVLIHPSTTLGSDVRIGDGVIVAAGSRLTTNITLGRHTHINVNCTVGHDVVIGDYVTLFSGVHLGGGVLVEEGATLGAGCVVLPNVRVGHGALVGAGAVVVRDVLPDTTVLGPAARMTLRTSAGTQGVLPE